MFIGPPKTDASYQLKKCQLVVRNKPVTRVIRDLSILTDIAKVSTCSSNSPVLVHVLVTVKL